MTYWALPFTFQLVLQSLILFPIACIFGKPAGFREGVLRFAWHDWFDERWPFATTLCYLMGCSRWSLENKELWFHEVGVHVVQYEDLAVLGDIIAGVVLLWGHFSGVTTWPLALGIWATAGPLWLLPFFLTALRYRQAGKALGWRLWRTMYMFSWHEKDAYAETAQFVRNGGGR